MVSNWYTFIRDWPQQIYFSDDVKCIKANFKSINDTNQTSIVVAKHSLYVYIGTYFRANPICDMRLVTSTQTQLWQNNYK